MTKKKGEFTVLRNIRAGMVVILLIYIGLIFQSKGDSDTPFADVQKAVVDAADDKNMTLAGTQEIKRFYGINPKDYEDITLPHRKHPPTQIETLAPYIRRIKISRPYSSVPKIYFAQGALKRSVTDIAFGSTELKSGTSIATTKITRNPIAPMISAGFARSFSFRSCLCSLKITSLASDILFLVKYIFSPPIYVPAGVLDQQSHKERPLPD